MSTERAVAATVWSAADVLLRQGVQLAVTVVLARLLSPVEFGTVALMSLFTGVAMTLVDGGFTTVLIQRKDVTRDDESTVFWLNLLVGFGLGTMLALAGPSIAAFYDTPVLQPLAAVLGFNIVLNALGTVPLAMRQRMLDFRTLAKASAFATLTSGTVAVTLAAQGAGIWALAIQIVVMSACTSAALWTLTGWRPTRTFRSDSAREMFSKGGFILAANLSDVLFARAYTVFAGRYYGLREVGYYNRAEATQQMPLQLLSVIFARVALPTFSEARDDPPRLRRGARTAVRALMLVNVPVMLGLAATSSAVVAVLFGPRWAPAAGLFSILCLAGTLWPLHVVNLQLLLAQGRVKLFLWVEIVKKAVGVSMLVFGAKVAGLEGLAWSQVAFAAIAFLVNAHFTSRFLGYGAWLQLRDVVPVFLVSTPIAAGAALVVEAWDAPPAVVFSAVMSAGAATYLAVAYAAKLAALEDFLGLLRRRNHASFGSALGDL